MNPTEQYFSFMQMPFYACMVSSQISCVLYLCMYVHVCMYKCIHQCFWIQSLRSTVFMYLYTYMYSIYIYYTECQLCTRIFARINVDVLISVIYKHLKYYLLKQYFINNHKNVYKHVLNLFVAYTTYYILVLEFVVEINDYFWKQRS